MWKKNEKNENKRDNVKEEKKIEVNPHVILASSSLTRIKILKKFFKNFEIKKHLVDEKLEKSLMTHLTAKDLAKYLAKKKAESVCNRSNDKYIIGCDQVLECNGKLISKAQNLVEAKENLAYLTGKKHQLFTCLYVLRNAEEYLVEETISQLYFKKISEKTIETYINENRNTALSCVGSYRIEDNDKYNFLEVLEGSEEAIIGFPLKNFIKKLRSN